MDFHDDKIWEMHISPGGPPPSDRPLPWNLRCYYMNDYMFIREAHIDSREPLEADWWKPFAEVERLEIHGDMPGGFDTVGRFTELRELVIYDSPSLESLEFLQGLLWLEQLQVIRCPRLTGAGPVAGLIRKQERLRKQGTEKNRYGEGVKRMDAVCIIDCAINDLSPFEGMEYLFELNLRGNYITDVRPLANCRIFYLDLSRNRIEDIRPLYRLIRAADAVYLNDNRIRDISGLTVHLEEDRRHLSCYGRLKLWLGNNAIPGTQLRENEDYIRDIAAEDISPEKRLWITTNCSDLFRGDKYRRAKDGDALGARTTIRYTERGLADCLELARRPSYSIRGRPVSRETAREIIRRTDGRLPLVYHPILWPRVKEERRYGWCRPDGYIGTDGYSGEKDPYLHEMLDLWAYLIENVTTELELVVGVSDQSEVFDPNRPIADQLYSGYHIRGDTITLLDAAQARRLYREYDAAYGLPGPPGG